MMVVLTGACADPEATPSAVGAPDSSVTASDPDEIAAPEQVGGQIRYGTDPAQYGWLTLPDTPQPAGGHAVVILVHGGFWSEPWDYTLMTPLAEDLVDRGYAVWNIEFRRLGGRGGWPETFDDVDAAIERLGEPDLATVLDLDDIVLVGHSSGGHLALWALDRPDATVTPSTGIGLGAVVDLPAFAKSVQLLGGTAESVPERYADAAPVLDPERVTLVHGANDDIVPLTTLTPAERANVPILVIQDADHFAVLDTASPSWSAVLEVLDDVRQ